MEEQDKFGAINTSRSNPSDSYYSYLKKDKFAPSVLSMSPEYSKYRDIIIISSIIIFLFVFLGIAIYVYNKVIENPKFAQFYNTLGITYYDKGQYDKAISYFTKAIEINPKYAEAYYKRGLAYFDKKEYEKAWNDVEKAQDLGRPIGSGFLQDLRKAVIGKMRISVILMKTKPQAEAIFKVLNDGTDFASLARLYSFGPSKEEGGDLGYIEAGYLMEELDIVAINLKVGEYSGIIETSNGYYIIMKTDERRE